MEKNYFPSNEDKKDSLNIIINQSDESAVDIPDGDLSID
jgi:hypothetical protein